MHSRWRFWRHPPSVRPGGPHRTPIRSSLHQARRRKRSIGRNVRAMRHRACGSHAASPAPVAGRARRHNNPRPPAGGCRGVVNKTEHGLIKKGEKSAHGDAARLLFQFGMRYANGDAVDLVAAHKWFNLAAMRGNQEAVRLRREIAAEMSPEEISAAQRAARDWLTTH